MEVYSMVMFKMDDGCNCLTVSLKMFYPDSSENIYMALSDVPMLNSEQVHHIMLIGNYGITFLHVNSEDNYIQIQKLIHDEKVRLSDINLSGVIFGIDVVDVKPVYLFNKLKVKNLHKIIFNITIIDRYLNYEMEEYNSHKLLLAFYELTGNIGYLNRYLKMIIMRNIINSHPFGFKMYMK